MNPATSTIPCRADSSRRAVTVGPVTGSARPVASAASAKPDPLVTSSGSTTRSAPSDTACSSSATAPRQVASGASTSMATWAAALPGSRPQSSSVAVTMTATGAR